MPKNRLRITIEDCRYCPCATVKFDQGNQDDVMYCQTTHNLIMLREGWGPRNIPDWCPLLKQQKIAHKRYVKARLDRGAFK